MLTQTFLKLKNWWISESTETIVKELKILESKHTKIRFDKDIYEVIRIH